MEYAVYTLLGVLLVCQTFSFILHWSHSPRQINRAFEALELEFEDLREHIASQLGRISRLKRTTMELNREEEPADASVATAGGFPLTPHQLKLQKQILARRGNHEVKPS